MKKRKWILVLMAVLTLLCTVPEIALADEVTEPAPTVSEPVTEVSEPATEVSQPATELSEPATEASEPALDESVNPPETEEPPAAEPPAAELPLVEGFVPLEAMSMDTLAVSNVSVSISVKASDNAPMKGVSLEAGRVGGSLRSLGSTNANGEITAVLEPGDYRFIASYCGTSKTVVETIDETHATVLFTTAEARIEAKGSDGSSLKGATIQYKSGSSTYGFGTTDENGIATKQLFVGSYDFVAGYCGTSSGYETVDIAGSGADKTFTATEARIEAKGSDGSSLRGATIQYKSGSSTYGFGTTDENGIATKQLFAGSYDFVAGYCGTSSGYETVDITGSGADKTFTATEARIEAKGSDGSSLKGALIQYKSGSSTYGFGTTDENGIATKQLFAGSYDFVAGYCGTSSGYETVDITGSGADKTFNATEAKIKVVDTSGTLLSGALIQYKSGGSTYGFGTTDENGIATKQLFAGIYDFVAGFRGTSSGYAPVDITLPDVDATFTATAVTLVFPGTIQYKSGSSTYGFTKPTQAMFPGTYTFTFSSSGKPTVTQVLTIGGTPYNVNLAVVSLKDSKGNGLAGGVVSYYAGGWVYNVATTGSDGLALLQVPASKNATSVTMNYKGGSIQTNQSMASNPYYVYQTKEVSFKLLSSEGGELPGGGAAYYASGWRNFGDNDEGVANSTMEMLPTKYSFAATYAGARQQQDNVDISATSEVVFTTKLVTVKLLDSKGNDLVGKADYYANGWHTFGGGSTTATMEMLPVKYSFAMSYGGSKQQMDNVDVGSNPLVVFQTGEVIIHYAGGTLAYYNSGWHDYTGAVEMLPVSTLFEFKKNGWPTQRVNITPVAGKSYEKTIAYVRLLSSTGAGIEGGAVSYYDSGWKDLGSTNSSGVYFGMMDGNKAKSFTFKMVLGGGSVQKSQNLATDSHVLFQTKAVTMKLLDSNGGALAGDASYYASGWKTFGNGTTEASMEMLPGSYTFRVGYKGATIQKSQNVATDPDVVFETVPVTVNLLSSEGDTLTGDASFYASGWKTLGATGSTVELLPTSYTFMVNYKGASIQKSQNVADGNTVVEFTTVPVTVKLTSSTGAPLAGDASFYASGWQTFGATGSTVELLPTSYTFRVGYTGASIQKSQNVADGNTVVEFNTVPVSFKLLSSFGRSLEGDASYYASGWKTFGDGKTSETMELLPTSYTFRIGYEGASIQKAQDVSTNRNVVFNTTLVTVSLSAKVKVMGLTGTIPILGPIGGNVTFYASGWKSMGKTMAFKQLLPTSYTFAVDFMGQRQQISQNVATDSSVEFSTTQELLKKALKEALS